MHIYVALHKCTVYVCYIHTRNALVLGGRECRGCGSEGKSEKVFSRCEISEETVEGEGERQAETAPFHPQVELLAVSICCRATVILYVLAQV